MIAWVVLVVICSLFTAEPLFAQDVRIELEGQALFSDMKAKVRFGDGGTEINADDELDMDDQALFEGRLTWHTGPNSRLRLAYAYVSNDGDSTVNRSINFGGVTFPAGVRVTSELEVNYARFGWFWQFLSLAEGKVKFGTLLEAKALWADVSLAGDVQVGNSRGRREVSNDYFLILPAVGLALDIKPHPMFQIYGEVAGMTAGQYGYFVDGEAGVKVIPIRNLSISGGYRYIDMKAKDDPDFVQVKYSGPFLGVAVRF